MNLIADLLFLAAALALGYATVLALLRLPLLPLREVVVSAPLREVTPAQIAYAVRSAAAGGLFAIDLEAVRAACEKLPWVRRAEVRRRWPDGIEIALEEHVAVARWQQAGGREGRLVNPYGEVFVAASAAALPLLSGPEGTAPEVLARWREFAALLEPSGRRPVGLALSPRQAWQLRLDDGVQLELGRDQARIGTRLRRLAAVYGRLPLPAAVIDLRYPNGFALRPAGAGERRK